VNLEALKKRNAANVKAIQFGDGVVHLRKLTATDGAIVGRALLAMGHTDPNGPEPSPDEQFEVNVLLLSKSIVSKGEFETYRLSLDSDEGRSELRNLSFADAKYLGTEALEWSGLLSDESKKN
jgi:hypothetical protein